MLELITMNRPRVVPPDPRAAVALLRVSTLDQELGHAAQRKAIEAWAEREGVRVVSWRVEQGVSGATPLERRAVLLEALGDLKALRAGLLVVARRDRLARDVVCAALIERLVERGGARVCSADGTGATTGPEGVLLRGMVDLFAAYERLIISSRTKAALAAKRARGERTGTVPFGSSAHADGKTLVEDKKEQAVIALVLSLRGSGRTIRGIVDECARRGVVSRAGTSLKKTQVERILRRGA